MHAIQNRKIFSIFASVNIHQNFIIYISKYSYTWKLIENYLIRKKYCTCYERNIRLKLKFFIFRKKDQHTSAPFSLLWYRQVWEPARDAVDCGVAGQTLAFHSPEYFLRSTSHWRVFSHFRLIYHVSHIILINFNLFIKVHKAYSIRKQFRVYHAESITVCNRCLGFQWNWNIM